MAVEPEERAAERRVAGASARDAPHGAAPRRVSRGDGRGEPAAGAEASAPRRRGGSRARRPCAARRREPACIAARARRRARPSAPTRNGPITANCALDTSDGSPPTASRAPARTRLDPRAGACSSTRRRGMPCARPSGLGRGREAAGHSGIHTARRRHA
jgi:hypothetical protein